VAIIYFLVICKWPSHMVPVDNLLL